MIALGELNLIGSIECELYSLFVRNCSPSRFPRIYNLSGSIDTNLHYHFSFLSESIQRHREFTLKTTTCKRPIVSFTTTMPYRIAFLPGALCVAVTFGIRTIGLAEEISHLLGLGDSLSLFLFAGTFGSFAFLFLFACALESERFLLGHDMLGWRSGVRVLRYFRRAGRCSRCRFSGLLSIR